MSLFPEKHISPLSKEQVVTYLVARLNQEPVPILPSNVHSLLDDALEKGALSAAEYLQDYSARRGINALAPVELKARCTERPYVFVWAGFALISGVFFGLLAGDSS
ncbi:hypothetical protein [Marinimicrobium sp. ABcell2]|uniref:hypothetical protein n=1 Tax=Marinimicrobium sp. ABcell2 TaxID=3069751 RepID=UPI0027B05F33|nr:hypothetical protein [Marinimicrobium sp. ABcell2]MDQ2075964.1 hypothetical protein [Marinimicrobium sp. ABcell2]